MNVSLRQPWLLLALLASGATLTARASDDARAWLGRMNEALTTRNYDGGFFHVHGGRVETMRIIHRVRDGSVMERLVSLDGSGREFVRTGTELVCYLPDKRTVLVERRPQETTLLGNLPRFDQSTQGFYDLKHVERARLMGRDTRVIAVLPKDGFRYGYRLWIDEATTMPLKTQLCDARGNVMEQIQFANLSLPRDIADAEFRPQVDTEGYKWLRQDARQERVAAGGASIVWRALRLPPGFRLTLRAAQAMPGSEGPVEHLVFSDGLASVSVFVEMSPDGKSPMTGPARVGSSSAFSTTVSGHQVTAVGEVPPETVRFIANSVEADRSGRTGGPAAPPPGLSLGPPPRR